MKSVTVNFNEKNLTGNAGLIHFGRFIKKLNLQKRLSEHIDVGQTNPTYTVANILILLILGALAGVKHVSHLDMLRNDEALRNIFKWEEFPVASTIGRILKKFTFRSCNEFSEVEAEVRQKIWEAEDCAEVTLDYDSSVKTVYGSQEGAEVGYNPGKKGKKSYHPIFCFIDQTRECLHAIFRPGNTYSANGCVEFAKECVARLPKGIEKIFVRADSAFFNGEFLGFWESIGATYLIKVKVKNLLTLLDGQRWEACVNHPGFEITEFYHKCGGWDKARRFVAVRELIRVETEGLLFPKYVYDYFCYVTNDGMTPWKAHKTYGKRAASENWIEWCKNQMAAGSMLTQSFWANHALFQTCVLAYNLMVWLTTRTQNQRKLIEEPNSIRYWLIKVPGRLLTGSGTLTLQLPKNWFYKDRWLKVEKGLDQLAFQ